MRRKLLDLFCCAGGAAVGYHRAGFDVIGVDIEDQPHYPFEFHRFDAMEVLDFMDLEQFDAIHASPPCQAYSDLAKRNKNAHRWPKLIDPLRESLEAIGKPYVIENVEGAPPCETRSCCAERCSPACAFSGIASSSPT